MTRDPSLPTGVEAGMKLCHVCKAWRPEEHVRDVRDVPTCTTCKPDAKLDPRPVEEPALEAARHGKPLKALRPRKAKAQ